MGATIDAIKGNNDAYCLASVETVCNAKHKSVKRLIHMNFT